MLRRLWGKAGGRICGERGWEVQFAGQFEEKLALGVCGAAFFHGKVVSSGLLAFTFQSFLCQTVQKLQVG